MTTFHVWGLISSAFGTRDTKNLLISFFLSFRSDSFKSLWSKYEGDRANSSAEAQRPTYWLPAFSLKMYLSFIPSITMQIQSEAIGGEMVHPTAIKVATPFLQLWNLQSPGKYTSCLNSGSRAFTAVEKSFWYQLYWWFSSNKGIPPFNTSG